MNHQPAPKSTYIGALRWYVHRRYTASARFGETRGPIEWVGSQIVGGTGSEGTPIGAPTRFASRAAALAYAHRQNARIYGPKEARQ